MRLHLHHEKREGDKVRLGGWANVVLTAALVYLAPDPIPAMFAGCVWILVVFGVTQAIGWHMDNKAKRLTGR